MTSPLFGFKIVIFNNYVFGFSEKNVLGYVDFVDIFRDTTKLDWFSIHFRVIVSKCAKIRNRFNQVPHLTQDTNGKVTNSHVLSR